MNRPNFVLFFGEDTGRHQGCYGDTYADTPNIDRLAAEGCRFTNGFSTAPVCAPSRSAMITGQYATKIGSMHMRSTLLDPPTLYTEQLRDAGYHVNWANKTDFNFEPPDSFTDKPGDWISELEAGNVPDKPFFFYWNFTDTHESRMWPPESEPPTPLDEPNVDDDHAGIPVPPYLPDTPTTRAALKRYYDRLHEQDALVGRIMAALDQNGLTENTIFIYMSDHGRGQIREKRWCYEAGIHLPLIVRAPGRQDIVEPGSVREDLVSWVDLAPTIHALAGIEIPDRYDGRIFLGPDTQAEPPCVFAARDRMDECFDRVRAARDRRLLYIRNDFPHLPWAQRLLYMETSPVTRQTRELYAAGKLRWPENAFMQPTKPAEELYDTVADPHCLHNLADRPDYEADLRRLRGHVEQWVASISDKAMVPEAELIEAGLVKDRREEYFSRKANLPEHLRDGGRYDTTLLMPGSE